MVPRWNQTSLCGRVEARVGGTRKAKVRSLGYVLVNEELFTLREGNRKKDDKKGFKED